LLLAIGTVIGGLRMCLGRTPKYERHVKRAEQVREAAPEQALADLGLALELAPEKERADILKQRGELYAKLGLREDAATDLAAFAEHPDAHKGAKVLSEIVGVELEGAAKASTEATLEGLRTSLMRDGALAAISYCERCREAFILSEQFLCPRCARKLAEPRFVKPHEAEAELAKLRQEGNAAHRGKRTTRIFVGIAVGLFVLCAGLGLWVALSQQRATKTAPEPPPAAGPAAESVFVFACPPDWKPITEKDVDALLKTSLEGLKPGGYSYIGGCYTGGVEDCRDCAKIVTIVVKNPSLPGTLTDQQYEALRQATEREMGERLLSFRRVAISGMPGVESIHIGKSRKTKLWELIIMPPQPGAAYLFSCSAHVEAFQQFEPIFAQAIAALQIKGPTAPTLPPAATLRPEPTPPQPPTRPPTPTVAATAQPVARFPWTAVVMAEALNLRSGPGSAYDKVGLLLKGQEIEVLARTADGDWAAVIAPDGAEGWVAAKYLDLDGNWESIPVKEPPAAPAP
jgi:hypothetical protein